jgi:hypothetical protein
VSRGRLSLGHAIAALAAFALMFVMAIDWYTDQQGEQLREAQEAVEGSRQTELQEAEREAGQRAEEHERNAWQEDRGIDRVLLVTLLATVGAAAFALLTYAAGRRFQGPLTPGGVVAGLALLSEALVTYRILQEPGVDSFTEVVAGPPLALLCLAAVSFGAFLAMRAEMEREPGEPIFGWRSEQDEERQTATGTRDAQAETS